MSQHREYRKASYSSSRPLPPRDKKSLNPGVPEIPFDPKRNYPPRRGFQAAGVGAGECDAGRGQQRGGSVMRKDEVRRKKAEGLPQTVAPTRLISSHGRYWFCRGFPTSRLGASEQVLSPSQLETLGEMLRSSSPRPLAAHNS